MSKHLVKADDGFIYGYHPIAAKRDDMLPANSMKEAERIRARILNEPVTEPDTVEVDEDDFVVSKATKKELTVFAKQEFNVDLDRRKGVDALRQEVAEMLGLES